MNDLTRDVIEVLRATFTPHELAQVQWYLFTSLFEEKATCIKCQEKVPEQYALDMNWLQVDSSWYCDSCRENKAWLQCSHCKLRFPHHMLTKRVCTTDGEGYFCANCLPNVMIQQGDTVVTAQTSRGGYYGEVMSIATRMVRVCWFKWGPVAQENRTPQNTIYAYELVTDLTKIDVDAWGGPNNWGATPSYTRHVEGN